MALLYGRAGRFTSKTRGFRPGQKSFDKSEDSQQLKMGFCAQVSKPAQHLDHAYCASSARPH
jgi:hypothetical protein